MLDRLGEPKKPTQTPEQLAAQIIEDALIPVLQSSGAVYGPVTRSIFMADYAPRVDIVAGKAIGVEALVRELKGERPDLFWPAPPDLREKNADGSFKHDADAAIEEYKRRLPSGKAPFAGFTPNATAEVFERELTAYKLSLD